MSVVRVHAYLQVKLAEIAELADFWRYLDKFVAAESQDSQVDQVPNVGRQQLEIIIAVKIEDFKQNKVLLLRSLFWPNGTNLFLSTDLQSLNLAFAYLP